MPHSPTSSSSDLSELYPITPHDLTPSAYHYHHNTFESKKPEHLQISTLGISPQEMIGKRLRRVTRSDTHPVITLHFIDDTTFQVRVDGYNPQYPGLPKTIETNPELEAILDGLDDRTHADTGFLISHSRLVAMTDRAFEIGKQGRTESEWKQVHNGIMLKFEGDTNWHCVWAILAEYDAQGDCIFRSYHDVYLERIERPTPKSPRKKGRGRKRHHRSAVANTP